MNEWNEIKTAYEVARLGTVSAAADELGGKSRAQGDVEEEQRQEADQTGDERIPRKARGRHVEGEILVHRSSP